MRLDLLLLQKGLASTRSKAQDLIRNGQVSVAGNVVTKAGAEVPEGAEVAVAGAEHPYVSRGGLKLAAALDGFGLSVSGRRALDVGQSTGGFTHCLLMRGAASVVGVEVGHGQLAPSLAGDPRVVLIERQDIRELDPAKLGERFDLCVADLSFISLELVLPALPAFLLPHADLVLLVKPQFEVGPGEIGGGGIVRDPAARAGALAKVEKLCSLRGFTVAGKMESPLTGGDGNVEYLLYLRGPRS